jgi:hypothetical protein
MLQGNNHEDERLKAEFMMDYFLKIVRERNPNLSNV